MNPLMNVAIWFIALFIFIVIAPIWYLADQLEKKANNALVDIFGV